MLIRNQEQQDELKIIRHVHCAWCHQELNHPRIVLEDANYTSYHVSCAVQLQASITADMLTFVDDPHVSKLARTIEVSNILSRGTPTKPEKK